jgi:hypothetical protein
MNSMNESFGMSHPVNGTSGWSSPNGITTEVWGSDLPQLVENTPIDDERARLEEELAALQARAEAARQRLADLDLRPALTVEVEASIRSSDAMEREHEARMEHIKESARIEVERILVEARATAVRRAVHDDALPLGDDDV